MSHDFFPKGTLSISKQMKLTFTPLSLKYTLKKHSIIELAEGDAITEEQVTELGFERVVSKKNASSLQPIRLKAKDDVTVLAESSANNKKRMITLFKPIANQLSPERRESGNAIKVLFNNVKLLDGKCALAKHELQKTAEPLFHRVPQIDDIEQGKFGDCFLLASLMAILNQASGADYIQSMMRQTESGTIVRLFHPETFEPHYIFVPNQMLYENGNKQSNHHAYWVHVIEQAYAIFACKNHGKKGIPAFEDMYGEGGSPRVALNILLGKSSTVVRTPKNNKIRQSNKELENIKKEIAMPLELCESTAPIHNSNAASSHHAEGSDADVILNQVDSLFKGNAASSPAGSIHRKIDRIGTAALMNNWLKETGRSKNTDIDDFDELNTPVDFQKLTDDVQEYQGMDILLADHLAEKTKDLPGNVGTGKYSAEQIEFYAQMSKAIKDEKILAATTHFKQPQPGLFSHHVYALIDYEVDIQTGLYYLIVRNPWGKIGQEMLLVDADTKFEDVKFKLTESPLFKVELTHFCRCFVTCTIAEKPELPKAITPLQINREQFYQKLMYHRAVLRRESTKASFFGSIIKERKIDGINQLVTLLANDKNENASLSSIVNTVKKDNKLLTWGIFSRMDSLFQEYTSNERYITAADSNLAPDYAKRHYHHFSPY